METAFVPAGLRALAVRSGPPPAVDVRYPCLQADQHAPDELRSRLLAIAAALPDVTIAPTELSVPGVALVLAERVARGKPEAFVRGREFAIVRSDGSLHVNLEPRCGQLLLDAGWATIHPLARYMAGVLPPQSLIVYAPRDQSELRVAATVVDAAHTFAVGRAGDLILPDSAW